MNALFEDFFGDKSPLLAGEKATAFMPRFDVSESDAGIDVSAELPGMDEKDIEVSTDGNILSIKGEKHTGHEENKTNYRVSERSYGTFQRSFSLPDGLDLEKVDAKFKDGVLKMHLPKTEESRKNVKKIKVNNQ
jgi:HSP20 family protein